MTITAHDVLDSVPDAIVFVNQEGSIVFANACVEDVLGYRPAELIEQAIENLLPARFRLAHRGCRASFLAAARRRPMGAGLDLYALHKDGYEIPVEIMLSPITIENDTLIAAAIRDISAHRQLEERLVEADKAKTRLLAAASHDLRQPVQTLVLLNGAAGVPGLDAAALRAIIAKQHSALRSLTRMLDSLLDISKLDAGLVLPEIASFHLRDLLDEIGAEFAPLAEEKGLELVIEPCSRAARTDRLLLTRILQNLVSNAIKYTSTGSVRLRCADDEAGIRLEVSDTGPGIPAEEIRAIFEEFHRLDTGRTGSDGLGLGLFIVKRTAGLLGCPIAVDSAPGSGSTFGIIVPAAETVAEPERPEEGRQGLRHRRARVLIIDDDVAVLEATRMLFELEGLGTTAISSAEDAIEHAEHARIDLLVVDHRLSDAQSGIDLIETLRSRQRRDIPAIIVSGDATDPKTVERLGTSAALRKPVDAERLLGLVESLLPAE